MNVSEIITCSSKPYKVKVISVLNPHVFWLEPAIESTREHCVIQAGLANVFPADIKSDDLIYQIHRYSSLKWIPAGRRHLLNAVSKAQDVYFLPLHVMNRDFSIINEVICIFGELFIYDEENKLKSVAQILNESGVLYKSSKRFAKYLKSGKIFIDVEGPEVDKVVEDAIHFANRSYSNFVNDEQGTGNLTNIKKLVNYYKKELKENLSTNGCGDGVDSNKVWKAMGKVYETCIQACEEEKYESHRAVADKQGATTLHDNPSQDNSTLKPGVTVTNSKVNEKNEKTNPSERTVSYCPAGINLARYSRDDKQLDTLHKVARYVDQVQRLKKDTTSEKQGTSTDHGRSSKVVSPQILNFINSIPRETKQCELSDCGSFYDCSDLETSFVSEKSMEVVNLQNNSDGHCKKSGVVRSETSSIVSSNSCFKLKFLNNSLLDNLRRIDDVDYESSSSTDVTSVVSTISNKHKFLAKQLKKTCYGNMNQHLSSDTDSIISTSSNVSNACKVQFLKGIIKRNMPTNNTSEISKNVAKHGFLKKVLGKMEVECATNSDTASSTVTDRSESTVVNTPVNKDCDLKRKFNAIKISSNKDSKHDSDATTSSSSLNAPSNLSKFRKHLENIKSSENKCKNSTSSSESISNSVVTHTKHNFLSGKLKKKETNQDTEESKSVSDSNKSCHLKNKFLFKSLSQCTVNSDDLKCATSSVSVESDNDSVCSKSSIMKHKFLRKDLCQQRNRNIDKLKCPSNEIKQEPDDLRYLKSSFAKNKFLSKNLTQNANREKLNCLTSDNTIMDSNNDSTCSKSLDTKKKFPSKNLTPFTTENKKDLNYSTINETKLEADEDSSSTLSQVKHRFLNKQIKCQSEKIKKTINSDANFEISDERLNIKSKFLSKDLINTKKSPTNWSKEVDNITAESPVICFSPIEEESCKIKESKDDNFKEIEDRTPEQDSCGGPYQHTIDQSKINQPKTDQPMINQPKTDQPMINQLNSDQLKINQSMIDQLNIHQPLLDQPNTDQIMTVQLKTNQPKIDGKKGYINQDHKEQIQCLDILNNTNTTASDKSTNMEVENNPDSDPDLVEDDSNEIATPSTISYNNVNSIIKFGRDSLERHGPFIRSSASPESKTKDVRHALNDYVKCYQDDLIEKLIAPKIVTHCKTGAMSKPWRDLEHTHFSPIVIKNLKTLGVHTPSKLQCSVWPNAFLDRSTFVIGPANSGRGVSILAPVCNKLPKIVMSDLPEGVGPLMMIVCKDIFTATKAYTTCKILLKDCITMNGDEYRVVKVDDWNDTNYLHSVMCGVDVLVTTAQCMHKFLSYDISIMNFHRLLYLILEDIDILDEQFQDETNAIIQTCQNAEQNTQSSALRVYATSQTWCRILENLVHTCCNPTVIVSALQECLFYSKPELNIALMMENNKLERLNEILNKEHEALFNKIVIFCSTDEEINNINHMIKDKYFTFLAGPGMKIDELNDIRKMWRGHNLHASSAIMIACDDNLEYVDVCDASWLIHYSLSKTYARFNLRFSTMANNYPNLFETKPKQCHIKVDLFITEDDLVRLPKLTQFIKRFNIHIPKSIDKVLRKVIEYQDVKKSEKFVPMCENLSSFGYCPDTWSCVERHSLVKQDLPDPCLPRNGKIKCYITSVQHASLFSGRLLEYIDCNGKKHLTSQKHLLLLLEMSAYFSSEGNRQYHRSVNCGDLCAIHLDNNYKRCRVLRMITVNQNRQSDIIRVNLLDEERYVDVHRHELLHLPNRFKKERSSIIKVRLASVTPSDDNDFWSTSATDMARKLVKPNNNEGLFVQGNVVLTIGNTLWLDDVQTCEYLDSLGVNVIKSNLKRQLLSHGYAVENHRHLEVLYNLCKSFNFTLPPVIKPTQMSTVIKRSKLEPQWAHLNEGYTDVLFSFGESLDLFFIRHNAFDKILCDLEKDLQIHIENMKNKFCSIDDDVSDTLIQKGYYCAALFVDEGTYNRAKVLKITEDSDKSRLYECYFVDYGEKRIVRSEDVYPINEELVRRLPFQAMECRLYGVKPMEGEWRGEETDKLYDFSFIDNKNLKCLVTKFYTKENAACTGGHKYGVILVDCITKMSFIDYIIKEQLALPLEEEMELIRGDNKDINNLYQDINYADGEKEIIENGNESYADLNIVDWTDSESENDEWDCQFYKENYQHLLQKDSLPRIQHSGKNETEKVLNKDDNVKRIIPIMNSSDIKSLRTPRILWHQNLENVTIKILLTDVNIYECNIGLKTLYFESTVNGVHHKLDIELFACIQEQKSYHVVKGMCVYIRLYKHIKAQWDYLTESNTVVNNKLIVYDPDFVMVQDEYESDIESKHLKDVIEGIVKEHESDSDIDDEEECDDVKALNMMELDPVNRELIKQIRKNMKTSNSDEVTDDSYDSEV